MNTPPSERLGTGTPRLSLNRWTFRTTPIQEFLEVAASQGIDAEAAGTVPRLSLNRWTFRTTPVQEIGRAHV